ncbi:PIN domain-containing protein [Saccharomonospora sp. CUA-673]|uniref:PIN domain-containing protein n=1 Tax=Saccharomonospora sp. CUA-673 TaxID=1904969 RepID=UPI000A7C47B9
MRREHRARLVLTPFGREDALATAELWPRTRRHGLSLADRACLALAQRLDRPVLTSDREWKASISLSMSD